MERVNILNVDRTEIHGAKSGIESFRRDGWAGGRIGVGKIVGRVEPICGENPFRSAPEYSQVVV